VSPPNAAIRRLGGDQAGQAMTEFVIMAAVMTIVAAYLYYPDNVVFRGIRITYDRTVAVVSGVEP
jgi:hypothetical protein